MTTIGWYHVLWQITFPVHNSQQDADTIFLEVNMLELYSSRESLPLSQVWMGTHFSDQQQLPAGLWAHLSRRLDDGGSLTICRYCSGGRDTDPCWQTRDWAFPCKMDSRVILFGLQYFSLFSSYLSFSLHTASGLTKDGQGLFLSGKPNGISTLRSQHCFVY